MKNIANYITLIRIVLSVILFLLEPLSLIFMIVYLLCGLSDIFDGLIARKLKVSTEFGARFDTLADLLFVIVSVIKIIPSIFKTVIITVWIWAVVILVIKLLSFGLICIKYNTFGFIHTYMNKFIGLLLFITPLFLELLDRNFVGYILCTIATVASLEELLIVILHNDLNLNRKSLFGRNVRRKLLNK